MNIWKCKIIFPTDTLMQKIEITDLKPFLANDNTSVLIILPTTVYKCSQMFDLDLDVHNYGGWAEKWNKQKNAVYTGCNFPKEQSTSDVILPMEPSCYQL